MAKGRDSKNARLIQDATGAAFTTCLNKARSLYAAGPGILDAYLEKLAKIPAVDAGTQSMPLCVNCLKPRSGAGHVCSGSVV